MSTTYGQKGGEGPTRGRKAITYEGVFPTGERFTKRSFDVNESTAVVYAFTLLSSSGKRKAGDWYPASVCAAGDKVPHGFVEDAQHARIPVTRLEK
jgi:hypothetical protein